MESGSGLNWSTQVVAACAIVGSGLLFVLIVRTDRPWAMNHGYFRNPEATARAWRNGWFHTGDAPRAGELPKTPIQKMQKHSLRTEGVTADT